MTAPENSMTDERDDLVAELRGKANDAECWADSYAPSDGLHKEWRQYGWLNGFRDSFRKAADEIERLQSRLAAMRSALEPFATATIGGKEWPIADFRPGENVTLSYSNIGTTLLKTDDFRLAREALSQAPLMITELKSAPSPPAPLDTHPVTLETVIDQLKHHRETHTEWADWFEKHPDDPRAVKEFGDATFHRHVERQYTKMIEFLSRPLSPLPERADAVGKVIEAARNYCHGKMLEGIDALTLVEALQELDALLALPPSRNPPRP
jgi:hypothetical protein